MEWSVFIQSILFFLNLGSVFPTDDGFHCPSDGIWPDPDNCQCFYDCAHDQAYQECCPDHEYFDTSFKICNWDYNVDCDGRPEPGEPTLPTSQESSTQTQSSTTAQELIWDKVATDVKIFDGSDYFDCVLRFEFRIEDTSDDVEIRKAEQTECIQSVYSENYVDRLDEHKFERPLERRTLVPISSQTGENLMCNVMTGMVKGNFLDCLMDTANCYVSTQHGSCQLPDQREYPQPHDSKERVPAEFYGKPLLRFLQLSKKDQNKPPLKWGQVGHTNRPRDENGNPLPTHDFYVQTPEDKHPVWKYLNCAKKGPVLYMFFMSQTSNLDQITENTEPSEELDTHMRNVFTMDNELWADPTDLDRNADDFIIPFYIGITDDVKQRYEDHNRKDAISKWRKMMKDREDWAEAEEKTSENFGLYFTFVELDNTIDTEIMEKFLLDMFDFINNGQGWGNNEASRTEKCVKCLTGNERKCAKCQLKPTAGQHQVKVPVPRMIEYINKHWLNNVIRVYPFVKGSFVHDITMDNVASFCEFNPTCPVKRSRGQ